MQLRRNLLTTHMQKAELYPIGTDIVGTYIGRGSNWEQYRIINATGMFVESSYAYYASSIFIPISPEYTYAKNRYRVGNDYGGYAAWYDKDYQFISSFRQNNLVAENLPKAPSNAAYLRISTYNAANRNSLTITRTA